MLSEWTVTGKSENNMGRLCNVINIYFGMADHLIFAKD